MVAGDEDNIIASHEQSFGENYGLMRFEPQEIKGEFRNYWQNSCGAIRVNFDQDSIDRISENALMLVPKMMDICLNKANRKIEDITWILTHQPNRYFIEQWRSALHVKESQGYGTLEKYGNLFQGSTPVTLADDLEKKLFKSGDTVCMGTFSNGGDYGTAMLIKLL